ncbi:MAG TPA: PKD domain-containing protein, partial [Chitinophagaceae bacterium]|nr:PKD domain-containing protein [Chitinophagaceae bacterium]
FWETENIYDGAVLQYSADGGSTWQNLGSKNDAVNCLNANWFNASSIRYVNNGEGWSGNVQPTMGSCQGGNGSGDWVIAQHTLPFLAGKASVQFRFLFGAGTQCNSYDGFAVDDVFIGEAPPVTADFTYTCVNSKTVNFSAVSNTCPVAYIWNFGDIFSGTNDTSALQNPSHTYTLAGSYGITLKIVTPAYDTVTVIKSFSIINAFPNVISNNSCNGDSSGIAYVAITGGGSSFNYLWNTNPVQTNDTAYNLAAGTYTATVSPAGDGCPATAAVVITEPPPFTTNVVATKPGCNKANGSMNVSVSGGAAPYTYQWYPNVSNSSSANNLTAGIYSITITDKNNCSFFLEYNLADSTGLNAFISTVSNVSCNGGHDGSAVVTPSGGALPYTYSWSPAGGSNAFANNLAAGKYFVTVTDASGCKT